MHWNVDPIIFSLGPLSLRYYSLMFIIGFVTMDYYVKNIFKANGKNPEIVSSLTSNIIVGMVIGARLAHCLFYDPSYYFSHPVEILYVWEGGLASHGGYLGVLIVVYLFLKKYKDLNFFWLMDAIVGPCLFVGGLIRIGNFMNSEIYGTATTLPWGIIFDRVDTLVRHPSQLYESIGYFSISAILFYCFSHYAKKWITGSNLCLAIVLSFSFRFLIEFTKDEQSSLLSNPTINMGQWLSLFFVIFGTSLFFYLKNKSKAVIRR